MIRSKLATIAGLFLFIAFVSYVVLSASGADMNAVKAANMRDEAQQ